MDPLSILSLAGAVLKLLSHGKEMVTLASEIHSSDAGVTEANERAAELASRTHALSVPSRSTGLCLNSAARRGTSSPRLASARMCAWSSTGNWRS